MKAPTVKDIKRFVSQHSWLDSEDEGDDYVNFTTREHGDMEDESPGREDIKKVKEVGRKLLAKYKGAISLDMDAVDEWVMLNVKIVTKESAMSTSELLGRLEEAAPKIAWKSKSADEWELYTHSEPEMNKLSKKAASALNKAMKAIAKEIGKLVTKQSYDEKWWSKKLGELHDKHVKAVVKEYRKTGIDDTEPRYHIAQSMIDMVKNWYGISGWTDLGDYI